MDRLGSRASPGSTSVELNTAVAIVPLPKVSVKVADHKVFPASAVVGKKGQEVSCRVPVPPQLHPLDGSQASNISIRVGPPMAIRPNYVHVKPINKLLTPEVALKLRRSVYGGELIIDFDVLVMEDAIHGGVSYPLRFPEAEIELEIPRVSKPPMLGVEREGEHLGRVFGGH